MTPRPAWLWWMWRSQRESGRLTWPIWPTTWRKMYVGAISIYLLKKSIYIYLYIHIPLTDSVMRHNPLFSCRWRCCPCSRTKTSLSQLWAARSWRWTASWCTTWTRRPRLSPWRTCRAGSSLSSWWWCWLWLLACWSWWVRPSAWHVVHVV